MVNIEMANPFIDGPRLNPKAAGSSLKINQITQAESTFLARVTEVLDGGKLRVEYPLDSPTLTGVGPSDGTITAVGAVVQVLVGSDGKIAKIFAPTALPSDVEVVATGATGWAIMDAQSGVNETREALDQAKTELESSQAELASNLSVTNAKIDAAQEYIDNTVTPGIAAAQSAADAAADAAAQAVADGVVSVVTEWAVGSSETVAPTSGWSTSTPARTAGTFIWSRTTTTKGDGTATTSDPVLVTGNTGATGTSVSSVTAYYCLVGAGASAPAAPTTNPPSSSWTLTEPAYQSSTELYRCDLTVMSDGSWSWGAVSKVSSYTAANAVQAAVDALRASARNLLAGTDVEFNNMYPSSGFSDKWGAYTINPATDSEYVLTFEASSTVDGDKIRCYFFSPATTTSVETSTGYSWTGSNGDGTALIALTTTPQRYWVKWKQSATTTTKRVFVGRCTAGEGTGTVTIRRPMLVAGNMPADWTPAPEDISDDIDAAQEAATQALTVANLATAMAQGLVTASTTAPDVTQVGRVWLVLNDAGNMIGMKISNGSAWTSYTLMADQVLVPSSVGTVSLANGAVTAPKITATSELWTKILAVAGDATIGGNLLANGAVTAPKITASSELWAKIANFAKVTTDMLIAGGAKITGTLLADVITLATRLVAGDPDGTRVELDGTGLTVYRTSVDGGVLPAIRLGLAGKSDFFGILDTSGDTLSSLDEDGNITGQTINANTGITLAGQDLAETLQSFPLGVIALAGATAFPPSISNLRTSYGLTEISFTAPFTGDRAIKVGVSFLLRQWGHSTNVSVVYTTDGTRPDVASPTLIRWTTPATNGETDFSVDFNTVTSISLQEGQTIRMLLMIAENGVDGNIAFVNSMNPRFWVEDIGPYSSFGGVVNSGGGALPGSSATPPATTAPVQTRTKTYSATACQSYLGSGNKYSYNVGKAYQGSYGSNTGLHSLWIFPSVISDLSGATVNKVILRITNQHSYYNSGATARIQTHGQTSVPTTYAGGTAVANVAFAKGQTKDINLTAAAAAGLKSGAIRGFGLLASAASDYGYWSGDAKLIITYTK